MIADPELLEKARRLAPKMDQASLEIFASSGLIRMLEIGGQPQSEIHRKGQHGDCTGFYQRKRK